MSFKGIGSILMLHRVQPYEPGNIIYNENMKISPDELESMILDLKKENGEFISLDQLAEYEYSKRHFFVFTLDDGYKDNLQYAYPIFKKFKIPFCIYITNSFPNQTTTLWWYALEKLVLQNEVLYDSGRQFNNSTVKQKRINFLRFRRRILDNHFLDPIGFLQSVGHLDFDLVKEIREKCLTWEEIKQLSYDPLVTIGSHTMNHYPLSKLHIDDATNEVIESKKELENRLNKKINHFAFPFGSRREAADREYQIAKTAGFATISTTVHGHIQKNPDLTCLNRVFIFPFKNNRTSIERELYWNIRSGFSFVKDFFGMKRSLRK
jgi:peptidoglycan/xylan/chitin deacetylase (PgdA/CDA1 family)